MWVDSVSYGSLGGERVFEGLMSDCWVGGEMVMPEMLTCLVMFLPQICTK